VFILCTKLHTAKIFSCSMHIHTKTITNYIIICVCVCVCVCLCAFVCECISSIYRLVVTSDVIVHSTYKNK
jgi:hypothetical protein